MSRQDRDFSCRCTPLPHCYNICIQQRCVNVRDERTLGRAGGWAPRLSLHLDAKHHSSMLHFYNTFCAICSTLRTHSSYEKLWGYMASEKSPGLSSRVSNCILSVIFKRNRESRLLLLSQCETQTPLQPPQMYCLFHNSQLLKLCNRRF